MNPPELLSIGVLISNDADATVLDQAAPDSVRPNSVRLTALGPLNCVPTDGGGRTINAPANEFANRLMTGGLDTIIFMTGVAVRQLVRQIGRSIPQQRFLDCLTDSTTIAGSPAAADALRELGVSPTVVLDSNST